LFAPYFSVQVQDAPRLAQARFVRAENEPEERIDGTVAGEEQPIGDGEAQDVEIPFARASGKVWDHAAGEGVGAPAGSQLDAMADKPSG